jgi:hypothetical protein
VLQDACDQMDDMIPRILRNWITDACDSLGTSG